MNPGLLRLGLLGASLVLLVIGATGFPPAGDAPGPGRATSATPTQTTAAGSAAPSPSPRTSAPSAGVSPGSGPSASPSPSPPPDAAPTSPSGFSLRRTVVQMGFPLPRSSAYRYANNFLQRRGGVPRWYNHVKAVLADGTLVRAHDGVDLFARRGSPVVSPFDGVVIDPATRWKPWNPGRYGLSAVIVSEEPTSRGYAALLVHLDRLIVQPGDRVARGEVIGTVGVTGNAIGTPIHLHFELRAPFLLRVREAGLVRRIDAFDPYPSLVAADPKRD
ncbi:MAG TPA: M23 family metallopeptidase [Candidatus Limnocylindrales bacterium]|nr:M23 family metallopeptidase [Candidatus Limnocylindrales bacterium]